MISQPWHMLHKDFYDSIVPVSACKHSIMTLDMTQFARSVQPWWWRTGVSSRLGWQSLRAIMTQSSTACCCPTLRPKDPETREAARQMIKARLRPVHVKSA